MVLIGINAPSEMPDPTRIKSIEELISSTNYFESEYIGPIIAC